MSENQFQKLGKDLKQLSKMLNRKENSAFKNNLRHQLLNQADMMNEKKQASAKKWKLPSLAFKWTLMPATAVLLIAIMLINATLPGGGSALIELGNISEASAYYDLKAVNEDETGVSQDTEFVLSSKGEIKAADIQENLIISPKTDVNVTQKDSNTVVIDPIKSLEKGEVYSIVLEAQNLEESPYKREYSWAYQVSEDFKITSTLPGNQTAGVPINSGIEIKVNSYGVTEEVFKNSFAITPSVAGNFTVNGKVLVFAPSTPFEEGVVYTVTLSKSLTASDAENALSEDYSFQFETSGEERGTTSLSFVSQAQEVSPDEPATFALYYYDTNYYDNNREVSIQLSVYRYESDKTFFEAIQKKDAAAPSWSYARGNALVEVKNLQKVMDIPELPILREEYGSQYIALPDKLPKGHYLVEASINENRVQTFLQVTNLATQININPSKPFVWVNSLVTGEAIKGAQVEMLKYGKKASTDKDGVAIITGLPTEPDKSVFEESYLKVEADGEVVYFHAPLTTSGNDAWTSYNDHFNYLQTDRNVYHPTDRIYYWGFLQGRDKELSGQTKVVIFDKDNWIWVGQKLADNSHELILYEDKRAIGDGDVFAGQFEIEKLLPNYYGNFSSYEASYQLAVLLDDKVVSVTSFSINDFVKPEYQITVKPEKKVLKNGESTKMKVQAEFFDGTKVSNGSLRYNYGYDDVQKYIDTNESGEASLTFSKPMRLCQYNRLESTDCELLNTVQVSVYPGKEELADIVGSENITQVRSSVGVIVDKSTYEEISFQTKKVDFDKLEAFQYAWDGSDIYSDNAPNTKVELRIERGDQIQTETGQYYDPVEKIVRKTYSYETRYTEIEPQSLISDAEGKVSYVPHLDSEKDYRIHARIYDEAGQSFVKSLWLYKGGNDFNKGYQLTEVSDKKSFVPGDTVSVKITNPDLTDEDLKNNRYLYLHSQRELEEIVPKNEPEFKVPFTKGAIPSITIDAYVFDGKKYHDLNQITAIFDQETKRLKVDVRSDKEKYEPGEKVKINVHTSNNTTGEDTTSTVNVYLVDEAYYALYSESFQDPLMALYSPIYPEQAFTYASHATMNKDMGGRGGCFVSGTQILMADGSTRNIEDIKKGDSILTRTSPLGSELSKGTVVATQKHIVDETILINDFLGVTAEHIIFLNGQFQLAGKAKVGDQLVNNEGKNITIHSIKKIQEQVAVYNFEVQKYHTYFANGVYVHNDKGGSRQDFLDTAVFEVVKTDLQGNAVVEFELPDNITSWRVSVGAIKGGDIQAGFGNAKIPVSKDIFAVPLINPEYLLGDKPSIPVRAYGDGLKAGQTVDYQMQSDSLGLDEKKNGEAFVSTYFDLLNLALGEHKITTSVASSSELDIPEPSKVNDTIILPTVVKDSHLTSRSMWGDVLTHRTALKGSSNNRTDVVFSNNEVGPIYSSLTEALYADIDRADTEANSVTASKWMNEYLDEEVEVGDIKTELYQRQGGISVTPYGDPELKFTAQLAVLNPELWDKGGLKKYFEAIIESADSSVGEKIQALYGLTAFGKKNLPMLDHFVNKETLEIEDKIYAALTYLAYGAKSKAEVLFIELLANSKEVSTQTIKITAKGASADDERSWTALMATIASELSSDKRDALWSYVIEGPNENEDLILNEKMTFIKSRLQKGVNTNVAFSLNGKRIELKGWETYKQNLLPSELLAEKFSNIKGEVYVQTNFTESVSLASFKKDSRIKVERSYSVDDVVTDSFKPGDLVKVHLKIQVPVILGGGYQVRDYLPSGLKLTTNPSFTQKESSSYAYPYQADDQEVNFYQYCGDEKATPESRCDNTREFYYFARVINKGSFIAEPAILQSLKDEAVLNVSSAQKGKIEIGE